MSAGSEVVVLGDAFVDILATSIKSTPTLGADCKCDEILQKPGGSGLNTSCHLASFTGGKVPISFYGCMGKDPFASFLKTKLSDSGVQDKSGACDAPTGACIVFSDGKDRGFISNLGANGSLGDCHLAALEEKIKKNIQQQIPTHLHISGYYCIPSTHTSLPSFLSRLRHLRPSSSLLSISLDANYDEREEWKGLRGILPLVDLFTPNETEAKKITQKETVEEAIPLLRRWMDGGKGEAEGEGGTGGDLVVTMGEEGLWYWGWGKEKVHLGVIGEVKSVDATGAGDCFMAGFLSRFITKKYTFEQCLLFGSASGALCVTKLGACDVLFSSKEVEEFGKLSG